MSRKNSARRYSMSMLTMRPRVIRDLPETVQVAIRKRAWRDDVSYEKAVTEMLHDAEIQRIVQHDLAVMRRERLLDYEAEFDSEPF